MEILYDNIDNKEFLKIIDFDRTANGILLYLGKSTCNEYYGDDWNDVPYEHNAGIVYDRYITTTTELHASLDLQVLLPEDDYGYLGNSPFCKDVFRDREVPFMIITKNDNWNYKYSDALEENNNEDRFFYFNDIFEPGIWYISKNLELKKIQ